MLNTSHSSRLAMHDPRRNKQTKMKINDILYYLAVLTGMSNAFMTVTKTWNQVHRNMVPSQPLVC